LPDVFLCYRRDDSGGHAGRLYDRLGSELGRDQVFMDIVIEPGANFVEHIEGAVGSSTVLVALIGSDWLTAENARGELRLHDPRDFVRLEIATALAKGIRVIPTLVGGARPPSAEDLPDELAPLASLHALELSDSRWEYDTGRLVSVLKKLVSPASHPAAAGAVVRATPREDRDTGGKGVGRYRAEADARRALAAGIERVARAVRATLGPNGQYVVIATDGGRERTRDGATIAGQVEAEDMAEQEGVALVREMAVGLRDMVGQGVTTAIVLADAMVRESVAAEAAGSSRVLLVKGLRRAVDQATARIATLATPVQGKEQIARLASGAVADDEIGAVLADAIEKVGKDGVVNVEEGQTFGIDLEFTEGMQFDQGYISPYMVTDQERLETALEDPYVLLTDRTVAAVQNVLPLLEQVIQSGKPLLIVAEDVEGETLATLVVNKLRGTFTSVAVKAPGFGDRRKRTLEDIAILTGGEVISEEVGFKLENTQLWQLGRARRAVVTKDTTTIVDGAGDSEAIKGRINQIRAEIESGGSRLMDLRFNHESRQSLHARLAKLAGGVSVIMVGAATETEMREKKHRVEDALQTARAALEEGVVPGAGVTLLRCAEAIDLDELEGDERIGAGIVRQALEAPLRQLADNSGLGGDDAASVLEATAPIEPAMVARHALQSAASLTEHVLTTEGVLAGRPATPAADPADDASLLGELSGPPLDAGAP